MSQVIDGVDAKSGAIPYGSRDSLAVQMLRQILRHMQKVNTRYNSYMQPPPVDNDSHTEQRQALISNPYRSTLQVEIIHTHFSFFNKVYVLLDGGPTTTQRMTPDEGTPITNRSIIVLSRTTDDAVGFIDFNTAPINPVTIVAEIEGV